MYLVLIRADSIGRLIDSWQKVIIKYWSFFFFNKDGKKCKGSNLSNENFSWFLRYLNEYFWALDCCDKKNLLHWTFPLGLRKLWWYFFIDQTTSDELSLKTIVKLGADQSALNMNFCLFPWSRPGRSSLGLPGRGVRSAGQHRTLQQSPLRQEPQQPGLPACGQLPAKRSGTAGGPTRGLPNELRPLAGAGGLLQTYFMGRIATVRINNCNHLHTWNQTVSVRSSDEPPTVLSLIDHRSMHYVTCSVQTEGDRWNLNFKSHPGVDF